MRNSGKYDISGVEMQSPQQKTFHAVPYKKGDLIDGKYEIHGILGEGGFGVVYLVYLHETESVYALKTLRDEYLANAEVRARFRKEAQVWVDLERHPYLLRAYFVDEIAGRLFIATDYIAPDEQGLNSLECYLEHKPPNLAQTLEWAIQFCCGMEYAYSKGLRCHRDIKPANILITADKTVKIADFGLAGILTPMESVAEAGSPFPGQTMAGTSFGTLTHMPPEQFLDAASCDERSDIYSFGIVLYQMATGGKLPFLAVLPRNGSKEEHMRFWWEMYELHRAAPVPRLDSPLGSIIQRCLAIKTNDRYINFGELRDELEPLLYRETGEVFQSAKSKRELDAWEWNNKGISFETLGQHEEAIRCFDQALALDPRCSAAWCNKGNRLDDLGRYEEAIRCYDQALELDPLDTNSWSNKGRTLNNLGRRTEAARCYSQALEIDPQCINAWCYKGACLDSLGRREEALYCYDQALKIDPHCTVAWNNKGNRLNDLGRYEEAILCYDRILDIDPWDTGAWSNGRPAVLDC